MAKFSILVGTCLNDRVPVDPMPVVNAVRNPVNFTSLGDWIYHDGTSDRNAMGIAEVSFPRGSGLVLTIGAAVSGRLPTGAVTVTNGGTGHPISRTADLPFWVRDPVTGADSAWGNLTTNASGVVTAATIVYGGKAGDYTTGSRAWTEDTDLWTMAHPESWPKRSRDFVLATVAMQQFKALRTAGRMKWYLTPDDHEYWNGGYPGANGSKCPPTVTTQAQAYTFGQTVSAGVAQLLAQDFDNPAWATPTTPYVPSGLVGLGLTGTEPFFKVRYFYKDYDNRGNETSTPTNAVLRLIYLDCLFEKGNYQTGSDDSTRNLISPVQEAWLDATQAAAVAAGIQSIGIMSSKDRYGQNSDGWISHQTQWNRITANIQAKGYPTWVVTGDRHVPHAAKTRVANGDNCDLEIVCPTALGATSDAIQLYKQMAWADQSPDVPVIGSIEVDPENKWTTISVHDMGTARVKYAVRIPFGSRVASRTWQATANVSPALPSPFVPVEFRFSGLWANRPTAGLRANVDRAFFSDVGVSGSEWIWDGAYWVPTAPVVLFRAAGTVAAPLATLTGVTSGTFATPGSMPAGMFIKPGMKLTAEARFRRSTATATSTVSVDVGGQNIGNQTFQAVINQGLRIQADMYAASATAQTVDNWLSPQAQSANPLADKSLNFNNAQTVTVALATANAADSYSLLSYSLTLYP